MPEVSTTAPAPGEVSLRAHAKLTLSLHITGTRADGYHELDATMVSVSEPHDTIVVRPAAQTSVTVTGPYAEGVPVDSSNLAWRAADACNATVEIEIHKGIPSGAGLGGGSADAAAVLVALGGSEAIAATLGADVPFCMRGGFAVVRGIGDQLGRGEFPMLSIVVATPPFACSTADVYRAWDELGGPHHDTNDLEAAAEHVEARMVDFKQSVENAAQRSAILAGSGSSYAVVFEYPAEAERARDRIAAAIDGSVWLGTSAPAGVVIDP